MTDLSDAYLIIQMIQYSGIFNLYYNALWILNINAQTEKKKML